MQVELGLVERRARPGCGGVGDPVGVVEDQPDVAQPADAGLRADGRQPDLHPRVAERALLGLAGAVVEVDLLVRAAGHAHPPAAAAVLVDQDDAVLGPLVHRAGRAGRDAGRVEAVLADPRQVEHERLLVLALRPGPATWSRIRSHDRVAGAACSGPPPRSSSQFALHVDLGRLRRSAATSAGPPGSRRRAAPTSASRSRRSTARSSRAMFGSTGLAKMRAASAHPAAGRSVSLPRRSSVQPPCHRSWSCVAARDTPGRVGSRRC